MYDVHDWARVHRLHHVEGLSKAAVAARLSMSRTTVHRLLALSEPPRYLRQQAGWQVEAFAEAIAAMLREDPKVPATVIAQRLRPQGFGGSVRNLKEYLRRVCLTFTRRWPTSGPVTSPGSWRRRTGGTRATTRRGGAP
jgi:transposase